MIQLRVILLYNMSKYNTTGSAEIRVTLMTSKFACVKSKEGMILASCIFPQVYIRPSSLHLLNEVALSSDHPLHTRPEGAACTLDVVTVHVVPAAPYGRLERFQVWVSDFTGLGL